MDLVQEVLRLWQSLSNAVGGDALAILLLTVVVFGLFVGTLVSRAILASEAYKKNKTVLDLLAQSIADFVFLAEFGNVDLAPWQAKADEREAAGEVYVDPRMLFVLDNVQRQFNEKYGLEFDFLDLLAKAERIYDEVRNDPSNSVGEVPSEPEDVTILPA